MPFKIDCHTHIIPTKLPNWTEKFGYGAFVHIQHHKPGFAKMIRGNQFFREIHENTWNPQLRINEYQHFNTQMQVICTVPVLFSYWARPKDGLEISVFLNDHIADIISQYPKHYIGLGTIPMQHTDLAITELRRLKKIGFKGIQIGSNINENNLHEPSYFPIFQACQELDMSIMIHPWNMMGENDMQRYWLPWLIGMPAETSRAVCSLIFGGIFERLPKLRVMFAHGGGSFLTTLGRIRQGYQCRPDLVAIDNPVDPGEYVGRFWIDSIMHDPVLFAYILQMKGSRRIVLGSDYPFPLGDLKIGSFLEEMNLSKEDLNNIYYQSACEWLGLDASIYTS